MRISASEWTKYITKLSKLSSTAGDMMQKWVDDNGFDDVDALIEYAYALTTRYGEASATLSCEMYDAIAEMQGASVASAEPVEMPSYGDIAKAINGVRKQSPSGQLYGTAVARQVKQAGADTTLKNAIRDGAQFAWIPSGDTCPFCIALASRGWQYASKKALRKGHAEHIHSHCDCQYAIRFDNKMQVDGYNPDEYLQMYESADGLKPNDKINAMRRMHYAQNRDVINEQHREAYAIRNEEN
ncbi:MAG: hypothetical protein KBT03_10820 [Bacteroidales bacterium]|nr:hypothetical protein [Candidatus Scybalousia scybalohippi]